MSGFDFGGGFFHVGLHFGAGGADAVGESGVLQGQNLGGHPGGVARAGLIHSHSAHREARRHLDGGEQGVETAHQPAGNRNADDGFDGAGRDGSGKVGGHACRADENGRAFGFFFADKALGTLRRAVGGADSEDVADAELLQNVGAGRYLFFIGF